LEWYLFNRVYVQNGVIQGGILSAVLFCFYFDGLLRRLSDAGIGCFMGNFFASVLAYADDLVLRAPTPRAMGLMLAVCDKYANDFCVSFIAS
jgi:Reverse transcriptase (RNA-dependent DNA polymerase)